MLLANASSGSAADTGAIGVVLAFGFVAVYALLPRARSALSPWQGYAAAVGALVSGGWLVLRPQTTTVELILFYGFALIAVVAGAMLITLRNPVHAALAFALVVLSTCGLFLLQAAPFLMAATIIVYAGAIVVTFLFVIMLAHQEGPSDADHRSREPFLACVAGFFLLGTLLYVLQRHYDTRVADALLERTRLAAAQTTANAIDATLDWPRWHDEYLRVAARVGAEADLKTIQEQILKVRAQWSDWKDAANVQAMQTALQGLAETVRMRLRDSRGDLQADVKLPLSDFSGLPANVSPSSPTLRHDAQGRVGIPAANLEALGRSVFTDYLIHVELAGTLLLVATIGAIAIAGRREGLR